MMKYKVGDKIGWQWKDRKPAYAIIHRIEETRHGDKLWGFWNDDPPGLESYIWANDKDIFLVHSRQCPMEVANVSME